MVKIFQCFLIALWVGPSPFPGTYPCPPLMFLPLFNIHSLSTHGASASLQTCAQGFPSMLVLPSFPHHHISVAMPPLQEAFLDRLQLLNNSHEISVKALTLCCAICILSCLYPLLPLNVDSLGAGEVSGPPHRILPPGGHSPIPPRGKSLVSRSLAPLTSVLVQDATCTTVHSTPGLRLTHLWVQHRGLCKWISG